MRSIDAKAIAIILIRIHGYRVFSVAKSSLSRAENEENEISISAWRAVLEELSILDTGDLRLHIRDKPIKNMEMTSIEMRDRSRRFRSLAELQTDSNTKRALLDAADELDAKAAEIESRQADTFNSNTGEI